MWAIRMIGWISVSTLTWIFFGLRWLEWFFWVCNFYAGISIASLLLRAGVNAHNPTALWINNHAPKLIQQLGILMSQTIAVRFLFWCSLLVIGYEFRDWQAYHEFTERDPANWTVTAQYPARNYPGMAYDILLADNKTKVPEFTPCEDPGLHVGMRIIKTGYYVKPNCVSFRGPRAYIVKEH